MHLHDVLRRWREEMLNPAPRMGLSEEATRSLPAEVRAGLSQDSVPGSLRRDERAGFSVHLAPATHRARGGAAFEALEALERRIGFQLPDGVELMLRLHDGGAFFDPQLEGLAEPWNQPLTLLSAAEMAAAYSELMVGMQAALEKGDFDSNDFFRLARRYGAPKEEAPIFAEQLSRVHGGWDRGLEIIPFSRPSGSKNLLVFVPRAGKKGRVGCLFESSGYLPEHSDDLPFEGLEGWFDAVLQSKACRRVVST